MRYDDEKDYIMRMIKEVVAVLISLLLGKKYVQVELTEESNSVAGKRLDEYKAMADRGEVNEAENILLDGSDYNSRKEVAAAVYFYQYLGEKGETFLQSHNYSMEEVLEGLKSLAKKAGYDSVCDVL